MEIEIPVKSKVLFSKTIPKYDKTGSRQVGSLTIEAKELLEARFIQLTQMKESFQDKPIKKTSVTFDPTNPSIRKCLLEALKVLSQNGD